MSNSPLTTSPGQELTLHTLAFNCSLKAADRPSSTAAMLSVGDAVRWHGAKGEVVHAAAFNISPGVRSNDDGPRCAARSTAQRQ